jgi:hypothetical protein
MDGQSKLIPKKPARPAANLGTFPFFQPRHATALKNVKEPKFTNRTPTPMYFEFDLADIKWSKLLEYYSNFQGFENSNTS